MAEVRGARGTFASSSRAPSPQLWRPANEVLQFLTECALPPPPPLTSTIASSGERSSAQPEASSVKRQPPARWEPPSQMRLMCAAPSSVGCSETTADMSRNSSHGSMHAESALLNESALKPRVDFESVCGRSENSVNIVESSNCSPRLPPGSSMDVWQFPRPSQSSSLKPASSDQSAQNLAPQNRPGEQSKGASKERGSLTGTFSGAGCAAHATTIPKITNAFARAACGQSSGWAFQTSTKASGFEKSAAKKNSFQAFASIGREKTFSKESQTVWQAEQKAVESSKAGNSGKCMESVMDADVSKSCPKLQENVASSQIRDQIVKQIEATNSKSGNDQPAGIDLLVNAVQVASGIPAVPVDKRVDSDKTSVANNVQSNGSSKMRKISYFLHGHVPFKRKKVRRRAKSAYPKCLKAFKDAASCIAVSPTYLAVSQCPQKHTNETSDGMGHKMVDKLGDLKNPIVKGKIIKQNPQLHKSLQAIISGNEVPTLQLKSGRVSMPSAHPHDTMISTLTTKRSRSKNVRRNYDTLR